MKVYRIVSYSAGATRKIAGSDSFVYLYRLERRVLYESLSEMVCHGDSRRYTSIERNKREVGLLPSGKFGSNR